MQITTKSFKDHLYVIDKQFKVFFGQTWIKLMESYVSIKKNNRSK